MADTNSQGQRLLTNCSSGPFHLFGYLCHWSLAFGMSFERADVLSAPSNALDLLCHKHILFVVERLGLIAQSRPNNRLVQSFVVSCLRPRLGSDIEPARRNRIVVTKISDRDDD